VIIIKDILEEIQKLRLARNWTEYELAVHSDLSQSTISTWYRKKQVPTIQSLEKICIGFGITLSQFFAGDDETFSLTSDQREMLNYWSALTRRQKELFIELFKTMP
jgi:transcriptional regulator with XRE-family HTH domain